jgi:hypothetical protein
MRAKIAAVSLSFALSAAVCSAPAAPPRPAQVTIVQPDYSAVNCSGFVTDQRFHDELHLISGEQSNYKITFSRGDYVYIDRGLDKGVRVGDRFSVIRPHEDPLKVSWFKWQEKLMHAMGVAYRDAGQVRVVNVQPKVSIAEVVFSCAYMLRGDIVVPYADRPAPPFKDPSTFDHFAPVSGKPVAMLVAGVDWAEAYGKNNTVYVNLGAEKGVKVGDYFRIFRYQGSTSETVPQTKGYEYELYGFGSAPQRYSWNELPREVLGEGIVLNVSRNSSTMFITFTSSEVYAGDYVELE